MSYLVTFIFYIENNIKSFHICTSSTKYWDLFLLSVTQMFNCLCCMLFYEYLLETKQNKCKIYFALSICRRCLSFCYFVCTYYYRKSVFNLLSIWFMMLCSSNSSSMNDNNNNNKHTICVTALFSSVLQSVKYTTTYTRIKQM